MMVRKTKLGSGTFVFRDVNTGRRVSIMASSPTIAARRATAKGLNWEFVEFKKKRR